MVQSKAATVDKWMLSVESERRPALERLRAVCRDRLAGWDERMQWGMPGYGPPGGDAVLSFNSQKQYIALYIGAAVIAAFESELIGIDRGKGCLRYRKPEQLDFAVVDAMLDLKRKNIEAAA